MFFSESVALTSLWTSEAEDTNDSTGVIYNGIAGQARNDDLVVFYGITPYKITK